MASTISSIINPPHARCVSRCTNDVYPYQTSNFSPQTIIISHLIVTCAPQYPPRYPEDYPPPPLVFRVRLQVRDYNISLLELQSMRRWIP
ncbi:unnamed protein product [Rhodiola kirilowii]